MKSSDLLSLYSVLLFIFGLIGYFSDNNVILLAVILNAILLSIGLLWNRYMFVGIRTERSFSKNKVNIGEKVYYQIEIENKKLLPVFWLRVEDEVTSGLDFSSGKIYYKIPGRRNIFCDLFNLKWYERVKRSYQIIPNKRGVFNISSGRVTSFGIFGFFKRHLKQKEISELIVLPRVLSLEELGVKLNLPFGDRAGKGWLYTDPTNRIGVRPYQSTDSFKQINWKTSARHLQLESNIEKPSFQRDLHIFLNSRSEEDYWLGFNQNIFEISIIYAASMIEYCCMKGYLVSFYSDALMKGRGSHTTIMGSKDIKNRERLMTALAMLQPYSNGSLARLMEMKKKSIKPGTTVIVITAIMNEELEKILAYYRKYSNLLIINLKEMREWDEIEDLGNLKDIHNNSII